MSGFTEWAATLPPMPGFDSGLVRVLLKAQEFSGAQSCVVIVMAESSDSWRLGHIRQHDPGTIVFIDKETFKPEKWLTLKERFGELDPRHVVEFIKAQKGFAWPYVLEQAAHEAAAIFAPSQAVSPVSWMAGVEEVLGYDPSTNWDNVFGTNPAGFRRKVGASLELMLSAELERDDPRKFIVEMDRKSAGSVMLPDLHVTLKSGTPREGAARMLCSILPGSVWVRESGQEQSDVLLRCGDYSPMAWCELQAEGLNHDLAHTVANDPVMAVEYGSHPMQVLVALDYMPNDSDVERMSGVPGVQHAARAEPEWVYGGRVVSLLVPDCDRTRASDIKDLTVLVRNRMRFFG